MKELVVGLKTIFSDSMSIFTRDSVTGRISLSVMNSMFYFVLPILIFIGTFFIDIPISKSLSEAIVGILAIFVVLSFQVIFIAADKFSLKVQNMIRQRTMEGIKTITLYEDEKNYLKRIGNYSRQFVRQLTLLIIISLIIIMCSLLLICFKYHILKIVVSSIMLPSFYLWILLLLKMIVSIYNLQMDDIKQNYSFIK